MANNLYDGILLPQGGIYPGAGPDVVFPSAPQALPDGVSRVTPEGLNVYSVKTTGVDSYGNPILNQVNANAVAQALAGAGGYGAGSIKANPVAAALSGTQMAGASGTAGWDGQDNFNKNQDRLPSRAVGYGENGVTGVTVNPALAAIASVTPKTYGMKSFTGSDPFGAYSRDYVAGLKPAATMKPTVFSPEAAGTGGLGIKMSKGMADTLNNDPRYANQRSGVAPTKAPVSITVPGGNKTQIALAAVANAARTPTPATQPAPLAGSYWANPQDTNAGYVVPSGVSGTNVLYPEASFSGGTTDSLGGTYYARHL